MNINNRKEITNLLATLNKIEKIMSYIKNCQIDDTHDIEIFGVKIEYYNGIRNTMLDKLTKVFTELKDEITKKLEIL